MEQIQLVFVLMSGKSEGDYYTVMKAVDRLLTDRLDGECFVADFKTANWLALKNRFPEVSIQGCAFHWAQAVYRKIREFGLHSEYNKVR